jgi:hypothetical protein
MKSASVSSSLLLLSRQFPQGRCHYATTWCCQVRKLAGGRREAKSLMSLGWTEINFPSYCSCPLLQSGQNRTFTIVSYCKARLIWLILQLDLLKSYDNWVTELREDIMGQNLKYWFWTPCMTAKRYHVVTRILRCERRSGPRQRVGKGQQKKWLVWGKPRPEKKIPNWIMAQWISHLRRRAKLEQGAHRQASSRRLL